MVLHVLTNLPVIPKIYIKQMKHWISQDTLFKKKNLSHFNWLVIRRLLSAGDNFILMTLGLLGYKRQISER